MDDLKNKLEEIKNSFIKSNDPNFIGLFVFGSQNYCLSNEESDIDCILLLKDPGGLPKEAATNYGKVKIYSLEKFIKLLSRGVPQAHEILCTKYRIVNPLYETILQNFTSNLYDCLDYEKIKAQLYKKLEEHLYYILWIVDQKSNQKYNKKRLYWAIRVHNQLMRIEAGEDFATSLVYKDILDLDLMKIKTENNCLSVKELKKIYKTLADYLHRRPRHLTKIMPKEEQCFSCLYAGLSS